MASMTRVRWAGVGLALGALVWVAASPARAQAPQNPTNPTYDGLDLFRQHCASCHGANGQGNGPMADHLRRPPADLTLIASRNGGMFPSARVERIIDGRDVGPHGNPEMPVWGDAFKVLPGGFSEVAVRARIRALVDHLAFIQRRTAQ
jgi:mono/diheme cytochrome c family protein